MITWWIIALLGFIAWISAFYDSIKYGIDWGKSLDFHYMMRPSVIVFVTCICGIFFLLFLDSVVRGEQLLKKLKNKYGRKVGIFIDNIFKPWEKDIQRMCKNLEIKGVKIQMDTNTKLKSSSISKIFEWPQIIIHKSFLAELEKNFDYDDYYAIVCFNLGHELAHIKKGDSNNRDNRILALIFLLVFILIFTLLGFVNFLVDWVWMENLTAFAFVISFVYLIFILFNAWGKNEYWKQINEFRADRIGFQLSNISEEVFKSFANYCIKEEFNRSKIKDMHPYWEVRIREIEKYKNKKWGIVDHIRYSWIFIWKLKIYRTWRI